MAIFMTLCLSIIVNTIETTEIKTADRNIRLNESAESGPVNYKSYIIFIIIFLHLIVPN